MPAADAVLAVALCVLAVGGLLSGQVQERPLTVTLPIAVISTLTIAVRTRFPVAVAGFISVLAVSQSLFAGGSSTTLWALVVFLVSAYTVAAERDEGWALVGLALVLGGQFLGEWLDHGSDYPFDTLVFGGVWLFGRGTRSWRNRAMHAEQQHSPDVVLMDVRMPRMDGIDATRKLVAAGSPARILVLTTFDLDDLVYAAMGAGASGFLLKDVPREQLVSAVRMVARGEAILSPALTRRLVERFVASPPPASGVPEVLEALSDRELEVFCTAGPGESNAEIAVRLFLGEATVKTHVARILAKLDPRERVQAVVLAYETGYLRPGSDRTP